MGYPLEARCNDLVVLVSYIQMESWTGDSSARSRGEPQSPPPPPILGKERKKSQKEKKLPEKKRKEKRKVWICHWVDKVDTGDAASFKCCQLLIEMCMLKTAES